MVTQPITRIAISHNVMWNVLHAINLDTRTTEHPLGLEGVMHGLHQVAAPRHVVRPKLPGLKNDEINRTLSAEDQPSE